VAHERSLERMVRRDEGGWGCVFGGLFLSSCGVPPAGVSPARVVAGEPGSRPQALGETLVSRAGRREPLWREQERGPQRYVKPAASSEKQWESRAAHVTAKAMSVGLVPDRLTGLSGVWGAARVQGGALNTRGPSQRPSSRRGASYKPMVKSSAVERESEGAVVLVMSVWHNAGGGKGPCGGCGEVRVSARECP
jgi:hypothetical protein